MTESHANTAATMPRSAATQGPRTLDDNAFDVLERRRGPVLEAMVALNTATGRIRLKGFTGGAFEAIDRSAGALQHLFGAVETREESFCLSELNRTDAPEAAKLREMYRDIRRTLGTLSGLVRGMERGRITGSSASDLLRASTEAVARIAACLRQESDMLCPYDRERAARLHTEP